MLINDTFSGELIFEANSFNSLAKKNTSQKTSGVVKLKFKAAGKIVIFNNDDLRDLLSKLTLLISDKDAEMAFNRDRFTILHGFVDQVESILLKLIFAGHPKFQSFEKIFTNLNSDQTIREMKIFISTMEQDLNRWHDEIKLLRDQHWVLNCYTVQQLHIISSIFQRIAEKVEITDQDAGLLKVLVPTISTQQLNKSLPSLISQSEFDGSFTKIAIILRELCGCNWLKSTFRNFDKTSMDSTHPSVYVVNQNSQESYLSIMHTLKIKPSAWNTLKCTNATTFEIASNLIKRAIQIGQMAASNNSEDLFFCLLDVQNWSFPHKPQWRN